MERVDGFGAGEAGVTDYPFARRIRANRPVVPVLAGKTGAVVLATRQPLTRRLFRRPPKWYRTVDTSKTCRRHCRSHTPQDDFRYAPPPPQHPKTGPADHGVRADCPVPDGAGLRPGHPIRSNPSASQTGNYAGSRRNRQSAHQPAYHGTDRNRQQQD